MRNGSSNVLSMRIVFSLTLACALVSGTPVVLPDSVAYAYDEAAAPWPERARGRSLPRPAWILVIPASRDAQGRLSVWNRDEDWTKSWRVPSIEGRTRIVTLMGDSEDLRTITADAFDGMEIAPIERVMRKYGAPAIALAVEAEESAAIAVYVPGYAASWNAVEKGETAASTHRQAVATIAEMISSGQGAVPTTETVSAPETDTIGIMAWRPSPDGYGAEFRLELTGSDRILNAVSSLPAVTMLDYYGSEGKTIATLRYDGDAENFETLLRETGIPVR